MRAQEIIHDTPSRFIDVGSAVELLRLASERCCNRKRVFPTSDATRSVAIRGFVCAGCGTAWNIPQSLWGRTVVLLPQEYRDYFDSEEGVLALCAALNAGAPGVSRGD